MSKVHHAENVKMRYTMKTNARRALKTRYGQIARDNAEALIHEDDIGFYIVEKEVLATVKAVENAAKQTAPAPAAAPATANVLRNSVNPAVMQSALDALKEEEVKDTKHAKAVEAVKVASAAKLEAPKSAPASKAVDKKAARCDFKNGARKPLKGKTAEVWAMGDKLLAKLGRTPELKEMKEAMPSYNGTTVAIQFYAWRKYNGLDA